jgi:hypothetical protein
VRRIISIAVICIVAAVCVYAYLHPEMVGFAGTHSSVAIDAPSGDESSPTARTARINWKAVDRSTDGFKVEMPEDPRQLQLPAFNEAGSTEPVNMIFSSPDGGTTYAVAWADNPPAMRTTNHSPDSTLDAARDGLLTRTQTSVVNETRCSPQGFPGRDILARNVGGGVLDARLIVDGQRLYMLTAAYPSMGARREQDVMRFFNSFSATPSEPVPQPVPTATKPGGQR